jgi:hypothetical protein
MKRKTIGIDPKVPAQLIVTLVVWALARYAGIDLSAQAEVLIGVVAGVLAGVLAPAAKTAVVTTETGA